ncbi:hypothetical protein [Pleurocapsa sp. FMAR1]|uniref:hypothetical protein n=1 Tax=Pleurocapsa sp. FMAR1 TaxID=3040204 RepID=UPI0029C6341C|nr:hypothetical protein [Pleurocapsa sp. FMAR1]
MKISCINDEGFLHALPYQSKTNKSRLFVHTKIKPTWTYSWLGDRTSISKKQSQINPPQDDGIICDSKVKNYSLNLD